MAADLDTLTMTELVQLQARVSETLRRRFERPRALVFTDVVASTAYFARYGDIAGRSLQQLHFDWLDRVLVAGGGRVVDTSGDGAFTVFSEAERAVECVAQLLESLATVNAARASEHQLVLRVGIHYGSVLTDGVQVTGDSVNIAARVAGASAAGEVRLSRAAYLELSGRWRMRCRSVGECELKGVAQPLELLQLVWRDAVTFPTRMVVVETQETHVLPTQDTVTLGRLKELDGRAANDIVLWHPDPQASMRISRWHFELRRSPSAMHLRAVSDQLTEVDEVPVPRGTEVVVRVGSVVRIARVLTVTLEADLQTEPGDVDPLAAGTLGFAGDRKSSGEVPP
ncbi:MAG: adenylate/guanylate cyclase domain-containing protein [Deltaproteobacteria bacterium]|nr:adenylate/guanylate cyclase domain-containing protein [Deltaproteobacteria bacterium]